MKVAEETEIDPGVDSPIAMMSAMFLSLIQPLFSTISYFRRVIMAYPEPNVKSPILKNEKNRLLYFRNIKNLLGKCRYEMMCFLCTDPDGPKKVNGQKALLLY